MASPFRLDGKVALVTGAGRGIGASIAVELARAGAKVIVNYASSSGPAEKVVAEIKELGSDAVAIQANVREVKETVRLFEAAKAHYGQLDIVVSNAGVVSFGHFGEVTEVSFPEQKCLWGECNTNMHGSQRRNSTASSVSTRAASFLSPARRTSTSAGAGASS